LEWAEKGARKEDVVRPTLQQRISAQISDDELKSLPYSFFKSLDNHGGVVVKSGMLWRKVAQQSYLITLWRLY